ncbi:MAG: PP2C family protein-serine/threonine phosphatase [Phycisphaerales bacterium]
MPPTQPHTMQCMEIWGGNQRVATSVQMPGLDAWIYSRPCTAAPGASARSGGDIHFLSSCATGRISRMFIADVSGHGESVAEIAVTLRRLMGRFSNYVDQARFVAAVNRRFAEMQAADDSLAGLFATALVATFFSPADELTISNAGHPRPFWFDSRANRWNPLVAPADPADSPPRDLPLGVLDDTVYTSSSIRLAPQDLVLIYTDPLLEAVGPDGRQLGQDGLAGLLASVSPAEPAEFISRLLVRLAAFAGRTPAPDGDCDFDDDITLLLLRRNDLKPVPSPLLGLRAGARLAARAVASLFNPDKPATFPQLRADSILGSVFDRFHKR